LDDQAGRAAGCRTALVGWEWRRAPTFPDVARPDVALPDLLAVAEHIGRRPEAAP
jgi:hypothetical protein